MAFANNAAVLTPDGDKMISTIKKGDKVKAKFDDDSWDVVTVDFSSGSKAYTTVIKIKFGNNQEVTVTPAQLFLVAPDALKAANELLITDKFINQSGGNIEIKSITEEDYSGSVYTIALSEHPTENTDGHLFLCNDIIVGGYALERGCQENNE
jgi:intein/homing endonuclease